MKSFEFSEEQFQNLDNIRKELFYDEHDPRSITYKRQLNRPRINWNKVCFFILCPIVIVTAVVIGLKHMNMSTAFCCIVATAIVLIYLSIFLKSAIICAVKIYQRFAPDSLRNKCRFEPSCSEYFILSIEKYGLLKGIKKGISRLKRCNINGGGFDLP